jgi:hypothetical protein
MSRTKRYLAHRDDAHHQKPRVLFYVITTMTFGKRSLLQRSRSKSHPIGYFCA